MSVLCVCVKVLKEELELVGFFSVKKLKSNEIATILKTHKYKQQMHY